MILGLLDGDRRDEALGLGLGLRLLSSPRLSGGFGFSFSFRDGRRALFSLFFRFFACLRRDR